jgi:type I restriction enzyme M protein
MDIVVYEDTSKQKIKMIVECKKPEEKLTDVDQQQLEIYMNLSDVEIGVLYNGNNSIYILRNRANNTFQTIPAIPKYGEKLSEVGLFTKDKLQKTHNLKHIFSEIQGWIVANGNVTRNETIAEQMVLLILCKIYDERFTETNTNCQFHTTLSDTDADVKNRIDRLFIATKTKYKDVITASDALVFDGKTSRGIVGRLQQFAIIHTERDVMADAFEVFISKSVKESEGQFFTPRNAINTIISAINLKITDKIIDSACGSGGFLVEALKKVEMLIDITGKNCGWTESAKLEEWKNCAIKNFRGLEKDPFLTKLSKSYMAILGDGKSGIFQEDTLDLPIKWQQQTQNEIKLGDFDILLANPPFGKNIKVEGKEKLSQFILAHKTDKKGKKSLLKQGNVSTLFLERNMQFLRDGGKMGIILPEPYFALKKYRDCMDFMFKNNNIMWVIDLPHNTFRPHNNAKCCAIIIQKNTKQQEYINMAVAEYIGHDHQGKAIYNEDKTIKDDTSQIIKEIIERQKNKGQLKTTFSRPLTFQVKADEVVKRGILVPRFYWETKIELIQKDAKKKKLNLIPLQKFIDEGIIEAFSGHGSPKGELKGEGDVPYIRVKDIVNWQPYFDVTALIPRTEYDKHFTSKKALKPNDILYVSRGSYRIGSVAIVSPYDGEMLLTREIVVIRVKDLNNKYGITPEYLLYALSHKYTWEQTENKVFYEPCLPNIDDRWKEIFIPIPQDKVAFTELKQKVANVVKNQWKSKEEIANLRKNFDVFMV